MNRESSLQIDSGIKEEKKTLPPVLMIIKLTKKTTRNLWMIFGSVEVDFLQCKYVYQAYHVTYLLTISSTSLQLGN